MSKIISCFWCQDWDFRLESIPLYNIRLWFWRQKCTPISLPCNVEITKAPNERVYKYLCSTPKLVLKLIVHWLIERFGLGWHLKSWQTHQESILHHLCWTKSLCGWILELQNKVATNITGMKHKENYVMMCHVYDLHPPNYFKKKTTPECLFLNEMLKKNNSYNISQVHLIQSGKHLTLWEKMCGKKIVSAEGVHIKYIFTLYLCSFKKYLPQEFLYSLWSAYFSLAEEDAQRAYLLTKRPQLLFFQFASFSLSTNFTSYLHFTAQQTWQFSKSAFLSHFQLFQWDRVCLTQLVSLLNFCLQITWTVLFTDGNSFNKH